LLLVSSKFDITGAGSIDLPNELINYRVIVDVKPDSLEKTKDKLLDIPLPVTVKGSFLSPDIGIDEKVWTKSLGKVVKDETKKEVKKKVKKEKKKLEKKIEEKLNDKLKGLFR